ELDVRDGYWQLTPRSSGDLHTASNPAASSSSSLAADQNRASDSSSSERAMFSSTRAASGAEAAVAGEVFVSLAAMDCQATFAQVSHFEVVNAVPVERPTHHSPA